MVKKEIKALMVESGKRPQVMVLNNATALIAAGVSAKVVQHRLGHSDVSITLNTYTHVLSDMDEDAAAKLNQSLFSTAMPISHPPVTI